MERARRVNLKRAAEMPDLIADETATRFMGDDGSNWHYLDTVESEITIKEGGSGADALRGRTLITRTHWRWNGNPLRERPPGLLPAAGFGAELRGLFEPQCQTVIRFDGRKKEGGKDVSVYRFSAPKGGCFGFLGDGQQRYNAARTGRFLVDDSRANVTEYQEEATGFPAGFTFGQRDEVESYESVKIEGVSYWLPKYGDFVWHSPHGDLTRVTVEYKNYQRIGASRPTLKLRPDSH